MHDLLGERQLGIAQYLLYVALSTIPELCVAQEGQCEQATLPSRQRPPELRVAPPPPPPLRLLIFGLLLCMLSLLNMRLFQCGCTWKGEVRARVTRFTPGCEAALSQLSRGRTKRGRLGLIVDQDLDYSFEISTEVSGTGLQGECARVQARERRHRNSGRARHVTRQSHSNRALTCSIRLRKPLKSSLYLVG